MTSGLEQGLYDPVSQYVMHNLKTFEGKPNVTLIPVLGLLCLLRKGSSLALRSGGRAGTAGSSSYVDGESIVERI